MWTSFTEMWFSFSGQPVIDPLPLFVAHPLVFFRTQSLLPTGDPEKANLFPKLPYRSAEARALDSWVPDLESGLNTTQKRRQSIFVTVCQWPRQQF